MRRAMERFLLLQTMGTCLMLTLSGSAFAATEVKGAPDELRRFLHPEARTVTIRGRAEVTAYSDLAKVTLVVATKEKTLTAALEANSQLRNSLAEGFIVGGIAQDRIKNTEFSSSPQYGLFGRKPKQFEVINRLEVTVDSEDQLTQLTQAADRHEAASIGSIEFEHSAKKALQQQVRNAALDDAVAQGTAYADKLALELQAVSF